MSIKPSAIITIAILQAIKIKGAPLNIKFAPIAQAAAKTIEQPLDTLAVKMAMWPISSIINAF